jgi:diguanylate cyclase (GGDEF)-like protein/PAS domain S-box-containing protein
MFARLLAAVASHPLTGLHLITHKVHERDRAWFDTCKLTHLHAAPGGMFELTRAGLLLLCAGIAAPWFLALWLGHCALIYIAHHLVSRWWRRGVDAAALLAIWQHFIVARALICMVVNGAALAMAPPDHLVPLVIFILATDAMVLFAHFPLPVAGLLSSWIATLGMAVALLLRPEVPAVPTLLLMILLMSSAHIRVFNLHFMFATRRLRTRELRTANDTIELLLTQYREHGSDCLVEVDCEGLIQDPSPQLCRLLGAEAEALSRAKLMHLFDQGPGPEAIRAAARRLQPFHDVSLSCAILGKTRWFVMSGCALLDSEGRHFGFRGFLRDVTDRHEAESKVRFLALHDSLTRLFNRTEFHDRLARRLGQQLGKLTGGPTACLFVDLDHFKLINDSLGHAAGDRVLEVVAERLRTSAGPQDVVARLGGDEFAFLLAAAPSAEAAMARARAIVADLSRPIGVEGRLIQLGTSVGVALAPDHAATADELLRAADMALYEAKSAGRGMAALYHPDMKRMLLDRRALELELHSALANGEFELHYQPLLDLADHRIAGYEALLRWRHPQRGMIGPVRFIGLAEQSGLIVPIGEWVLREAMAEAARWADDLTIAVNVSAVQMRDGALLRQVVSALAATGLPAHRLELEITETVLMQDQDACLALLHQLRALGVRIALDDFGTGYSSLNYLRAFPFDKIKIDRCFVTDLGAGGEGAAIVESVLDLAARLNMQTIAEGVEEPAQLAALRDLGCAQVQGNLISVPVPAAQLPVARLAPAPLPAVRRARRARG